MRLARNIVWAVLALGVAAPVPAQAQQALNSRSAASSSPARTRRIDGDVLVANRDMLRFDIDDFNGRSIGVEWLLPFGEFFEVGAGRRLHQPHRADRLRPTSSTATAARSSRT